MKLIQELFANAVLDEKSKDKLIKQVQESKKPEEEIILENKVVTEDYLFELKSKITKIPLKKIKAEDLSLDILMLISEESAINYKMVPLAKDKSSVEIGMVYPEDVLAQNALRFLSRQENFEYKIFLITPTTLSNLLKQYKNLKTETTKALEELDKEKKNIKDIAVTNPKIMAEDAPIIKMFLLILRHAIENNASDIHIEPSREKLTVRFRQDGVLFPSLFLPISVHPAIVARIKIVSGLKIDENRMPQDGRFATKIDEREIDFRVSTLPTLYGEKVVIRVLDQRAGLKPFDQLGIRERSLELIKEAIKKPYGLVLATGPTGSGKTTTLYSLLRLLNQDGVNIITLEDPVEYSIAGVNQSQINPDIGYSFAQGLRQILRQDPNVIMVGEIRDGETAELAINAALTGHIVLSTLHTNSATGVVPRLVDMGVKPFLIPSTLKIAISQRLVRTLCQNCKEKIKPTEELKKYIIERYKSIPLFAKKEVEIKEDDFYIYQAKGCETCGMKGYTGRRGLYEVFAMTDEIAEVISTNPEERAIFKVAQKQGMLTMEQEGIIKVLTGETTIQEVTRVTEEK